MNVLDHLKNLEVEAIKNYCAERCSAAAVAMTHIEGDFNLSNVLRSANFFGFKEAFYVGGSKRYDRRGTVGTHHYTPLTFCKTYDEFLSIVNERNYHLVALENNINYPCQNIYNYNWKPNTMLVVGEERNGIPDTILSRCKDYITIPVRGSVRSLNAASAASIAMSFYNKQYE